MEKLTNWVDEVYVPPKYTRYCFVPGCGNDSLKAPEKHFFHVPHRHKEEWCRAVGKLVVPKRPLVICEDHLDLEYDLENYEKWKLLKGNAKLKPSVPFLKKLSKPMGTIHSVDGEPGPTKSSKESRKVPSFKSTKSSKESCEGPSFGPTKTLKESYVGPSFGPTKSSKESCEGLSFGPTKSSKESCKGLSFEDKAVMCTPKSAAITIQVNPVMRDRSVNCNILSNGMNQAEIQGEIGPLQLSSKGSTTEVSEWETSYEPTTSTCSAIQPTVLNGQLFMLSLIERKPFQYIGIPKKLYWIVDYLSNAHKDIKKIHIIITLYRIKSNDTFLRIGDLFQISQTTLWSMFGKTLSFLSTFFKQFIVWPDALAIKKNLPCAFTTSAEYANVQAIIDAFEIEIEKPSNPVHQSLTWSQYKNCNTIKYLISATPDGLINFISKGYGGRISDVTLVEVSGFLDVVQHDSCILADRGFKHLETILNKKSIKLLRPPSVFSDKKMTKAEVIQTKLIASLRVHIERVIRRVRVYKFLKPHSVINNKCVCFLDNAVVTACGAINLQSPIIKKE